MDDKLRFVVYTPGNVFLRDFTVDGTVDLNCNGVSVAEFTLDDDDPALPAVTSVGARCAVWFRGVELFRGVIRETPGEGPNGGVTCRVMSDFQKVWEWPVWMNPAAAVTAQTDEFRVFTGKSEANFKTALSEAVTRLGRSWTVAADHGYGTVQPVDMRMDFIGDKIVPQLDADRLVVTFTYDAGGDPTVDVREPATVPGWLTLESGVPDSYKFTRTAPTATRAVVGGRGEGVDREFVYVIDTDREAELGDVIEIFVDAGNTDEDTDLETVGQAALAAAGSKVSVSTELVETGRFRFLSTYQLGDLVQVRLGPVEVVEQIRQVSITTSFEGGAVVTPKIGDAGGDAPNVRLARQVADLARGLRDQRRR